MTTIPFNDIPEDDVIYIRRWGSIVKSNLGPNVVFAPVGELLDVFTKVKHDCILVIETGDYCIFRNMDGYVIKTLMRTKYCDFADFPKNFKKIYSTNLDIEPNDRFCAIPAGMMERDEFPQVAKCDKNKLLYVNFRPTNAKRMSIRPFVDKNMSWATVRWPHEKETGVELLDTFQNMASHKFVLSPEGNGIDCFRHWESLRFGAFPIVEKSPFTSHFNDLPMLQLDDLSMVTEDFLNAKYDEMVQKKEWNWKKLRKSYWLDRIRKDALELCS